MVKLVKAHVFKYKSIEDSTPVEISDRVSVLVGKNESGKTAFLEALHKALPFDRAKFDPVQDYPRKDLVSYQVRHDAKDYDTVVELTFRVDPALAKRINEEVFSGEAVVPSQMEFTRSCDYANESKVGVPVDDTIAVMALQKTLHGLEHVDEVFVGAKRLEDVLTKVEALKLANEHQLSKFAAEWRTRSAGASANWSAVRWFIWTTYLKPALPEFLYFDEYKLLKGKVNLPGLQQRLANKQLAESDETVFGLLDLAGITLEGLAAEVGYEQTKAKLEAIGLNITNQVFHYWNQNRRLAVEFDTSTDPHDRPPYNAGKNLYVRVKNEVHGVTVPFDQQSKGFMWFFSFIAWFSAIERRVGSQNDLILLLDEPGLSLHALAQADFLSYIEELSKKHQVLYTTHSPFMVDSDHLDRVRVVEDRTRLGSVVSTDLAGHSEGSLFPLQAALGYTIAQNLFVAKKNVLVEGPSDLIILQHMSSLLEQSGKVGLKEGVLVPTGGLDKIATFVALLGANKLTLAVIHDRGSSPQQTLDDIVKQKLIERKRVLDYSMFCIPARAECDLEDLLPEDIYIAAFNRAYAKELGASPVAAAELGKQPRIVARIDQWLSGQGRCAPEGRRLQPLSRCASAAFCSERGGGPRTVPDAVRESVRSFELGIG
jgi:energy-coupling factor transporter ATP-binding protein EcfA2